MQRQIPARAPWSTSEASAAAMRQFRACGRCASLCLSISTHHMHENQPFTSVNRPAVDCVNKHHRTTWPPLSPLITSMWLIHSGKAEQSAPTSSHEGQSRADWLSSREKTQYKCNLLTDHGIHSDSVAKSHWQFLFPANSWLLGNYWLKAARAEPQFMYPPGAGEVRQEEDSKVHCSYDWPRLRQRAPMPTLNSAIITMVKDDTTSFGERPCAL